MSTEIRFDLSYQRCGGTPGHKARPAGPQIRSARTELSELRLRHYRRRGYVAQLHLRRSKPTEAMIEAHGLTIVVLVRNLFDIVVSWRDHMRNENPVGAMAYFTEEHCKLPDDELERAIARLFVPWNINFYMSWREYPNALLVRYEDMIASPAHTLRAIAEKAGRPVSDAAIENAIELASRRKNRFNVGVTGRGEALSQETKQDILDMLAYYPGAADDAYISDMTQRSIPDFRRGSAAETKSLLARPLLNTAA